MNLLRYDFAWGLKVNFDPTYNDAGYGIVGQTWSANEVDFTDVREHYFQRMRPVRNIFIGVYLQGVPLCFRVQIWEDLRIIDGKCQYRSFHDDLSGA